MREAVDAGVPVLGLCFGGQALSLALGGGVDVLDRPEIGWFPIETVDGDPFPSGPWLMWHTEQMRVPPGGVELARSPAGPAAFAFGPHLARPVPSRGRRRARRGLGGADEHLAAVGLTPDDVVAQREVHAPAAREQAFALFDRWLAGAVLTAALRTTPAPTSSPL